MCRRCFLAELVTIVVTSTANAVIINVPGDQPTIQAGINAAVNGDEVVVAPGTYFETINFLGKAITVRSTDPIDSDIVAATIIDGTGFFHVVQCVNHEGPDTVLNGFTITGGNANGPFPDNLGGGMYNNGSSPTVTNCTFSGNSAIFGGGMYNVSSSPTVTHCTFSENSVIHPDGIGFGGGMRNLRSNPIVTNCTFTRNSTDSLGGGMANWTSNPTVTNCMFSGNTAGNLGGGISTRYSNNPKVTNCTFSENSAVNGGGGDVQL